MKRYISILLCTLSATAMVSCADWFDISPKTDVKASQLFESEAGFQSALTGLYVKMTDNAVYGKAYTMGFMERLVQHYDNVSDANKVNIYTYDVSNSAGAKGTQADLWIGMYKVIANANNLLKWLDLNGERVLPDESTRNRMRGEALAVRAMLHFDLLRGWGPMYRSDSLSQAIPYRLVIDGSRQPRLPANKVVSLVIDDLKAAEQLLSYQEDTKLSGIANQNNRYHFTIHSVRGLMARVMNYRNDKEGACYYAHLAIDGSNLTLANDQTLLEDPAMFCETLFGLNYYDMSNQMNEWTESSPESAHQYILRSNLEQLYANANDARYRANLGFLHFMDVSPAKAITRKYVRNQNLIPMIRLAEMYYILCEASPLEEADRWLTLVNEQRGLNPSGQFGSDELRIEALDAEYNKEFYGEGQYFHFLKLHERTTFLNCPLEFGMSKAQYVFPLPDDEVEYGWIEGMDDDSEESDDRTDNGDGEEEDAE